jgi:glycosyltransferase involved in cell wall biosynthesis
MPVCNEAEVIESVFEEWFRDVFQYLPAGSELIVAEAASTDGTREILQRLCQEHSFMRVIYRDVKDGFAAAARTLYTEARCPFVFFTDSDGQYVPREFWRLAPFVAEFSVVHGAKIGRQDPLFRKIASALFNRIARFIFDVHYSDINSAFRVMRTELVKELLPQIHCMPTLFNAELLLRAELENRSIKQVYVRHRRRMKGVSRGLPPGRFLKESWAAYRGLLALKTEYKLVGEDS